jgi:hypothetical protein
MAVAGFAVVCFAVTDFAVATGFGFATAAFATGRRRITTTGLLFASWLFSGIGVFFLESPGKSILTAVPSFVIVTAEHGVLCSPVSPRASYGQCVACDQSRSHLIPPR